MRADDRGVRALARADAAIRAGRARADPRRLGAGDLVVAVPAAAGGGERGADGEECTRAREDSVKSCRQTLEATDRLTTVKTDMDTKEIHKHTAVTTLAIRQRHGVPYKVERVVCADCRALLAEKPVKRAEAA